MDNFHLKTVNYDRCRAARFLWNTVRATGTLRWIANFTNRRIIIRLLSKRTVPTKFASQFTGKQLKLDNLYVLLNSEYGSGFFTWSKLQISVIGLYFYWLSKGRCYATAMLLSVFARVTFTCLIYCDCSALQLIRTQWLCNNQITYITRVSLLLSELLPNGCDYLNNKNDTW